MASRPDLVRQPPQREVRKLLRTADVCQEHGPDHDGEDPKGEDGLFTSAVFDKNTGEYIVKVINTTDKAQTVDIKFDGLKKIEGNAATVTLDCSDYTLDNTLDHPNAIIPQDGWAAVEGNVIKTTVQGKNFVIFKVKK